MSREPGAHRPTSPGPRADHAVRPAVREDAGGIATVWLTRHEGKHADVARVIAGELDMVSRGEGRLVFVAVRNEQIVAYSRARLWKPEEVATYRACPAGWWLSGTLVLESCQRQGIGTALMQARLSVLPAPVYSKVDVANTASRAWHAANGFEEVTRDFTSPRTRDPREPMVLLCWSGFARRDHATERGSR